MLKSGIFLALLCALLLAHNVHAQLADDALPVDADALLDAKCEEEAQSEVYCTRLGGYITTQVMAVRAGLEFMKRDWCARLEQAREERQMLGECNSGLIERVQKSINEEVDRKFQSRRSQLASELTSKKYAPTAHFEGKSNIVRKFLKIGK